MKGVDDVKCRLNWQMWREWVMQDCLRMHTFTDLKEEWKWKDLQKDSSINSESQNSPCWHKPWFERRGKLHKERKVQPVYKLMTFQLIAAHPTLHYMLVLFAEQQESINSTQFSWLCLNMGSYYFSILHNLCISLPL
jgi:hypothetical protein